VVTKEGEAFEAWRTADQAARQAERLLQRAWDDYSSGRGSPPSKSLIRDVTQLRAAAHEKLTQAIAVVDTEVELRRHPPVKGGRPSAR
jgi:ferric-dicitrate binding protein FerR (iron transport regulator)